MTPDERPTYAVEHVRADGPQRLLLGDCDIDDGRFHNKWKADAYAAWLEKYWPACVIRVVVCG